MRDFQIPGRSAVYAQNGICATSHPLAAHVAVDTLRRGGNAMDAAIAGAVLLGICEPQMTGIGGDCFVLWSKGPDAPVQSLNGSGRAPAASSADSLRARGISSVPLNTPEAVTIPGAIDAFCHLSETEGRLGIDALLAPAIHYAEEGVPVAPRVALDWAKQQGTLQGAARDHYLIGGAVPQTGQIFRAPAQAAALREIARNGRDGFYTGPVAEDMCGALHAMGGVHDLADFASTCCTPTTPISGHYKEFELMEHPPNGQGATAILLLNILAHFDLPGLDPFGADRLHIEAEAAKLAYNARNRLIADPDVSDATARMLDKGFAAQLAALIQMDRAIEDAQSITEAVHKDTVYITVVDRDRMAVSLIYSIFHGFGSGIASPKYGILLQNRGAGFTLTPGHPNEFGPGKRPMHTIIPGMLRQNGRVVMPFGVMGGQYQSAGHARFVTNMMDYGMDPQSAIDAPRSFPDQGKLGIENRISDAVAADLAARGHVINRLDMALGGAQAIRIDDAGYLEGASDPRKDGCALGY
jgi:gamma-glutamyltranspeptidase/glutathione hydrolase